MLSSLKTAFYDWLAPTKPDSSLITATPRNTPRPAHTSKPAIRFAPLAKPDPARHSFRHSHTTRRAPPSGPRRTSSGRKVLLPRLVPSHPLYDVLHGLSTQFSDLALRLPLLKPAVAVGVNEGGGGGAKDRELRDAEIGRIMKTCWKFWNAVLPDVEGKMRFGPIYGCLKDGLERVWDRGDVRGAETKYWSQVKRYFRYNEADEVQKRIAAGLVTPPEEIEAMGSGSRSVASFGIDRWR